MVLKKIFIRSNKMLNVLIQKMFLKFKFSARGGYGKLFISQNDKKLRETIYIMA